MRIIVLTFFLPFLNWLIAKPEHQPGRKKHAVVILKAKTPIHVDLTIEARTKKDVTSVLTLTNQSNEDVLLYKPILPSDTLREDEFIILPVEQEVVSPLPHIPQKSDQKYLDVPPSKHLPNIVVPQLKRENFVFLSPNQTIRLKMNLALHYRFMGKGEYEASFMAFMPLVTKEMKPVSEKDSLDGQVKLVYYLLQSGSSADPSNLGRVRFRLK